MGVDRNTSIGPYMIVLGEKVEEIERSANACSDKECDNYKSNKEISEKFCSKCGSTVKPKLFKEEYKRDAYKLLWDLEDEGIIDEEEFCWTDPMGCGGGVFLANESSPFEIKRRKNDDGIKGYDEVIDLTGINSSEEITWFNERYKKAIDIFKKEFGEDNVKIGWGVIEWYS